MSGVLFWDRQTRCYLTTAAKRKLFFTTAEAATEAGMSPRHFARLVEKLGMTPCQFQRKGPGAPVKHMWTWAHIEAAKRGK